MRVGVLKTLLITMWKRYSYVTIGFCIINEEQRKLVKGKYFKGHLDENVFQISILGDALRRQYELLPYLKIS
jgi:hypothetical protein